MSTVTAYALPTPTIRTPNVHACGVSNGSCPMVRSNSHAARTDTANWKVFTRPFYKKEVARAT